VIGDREVTVLIMSILSGTVFDIFIFLFFPFIGHILH